MIKQHIKKVAISIYMVLTIVSFIYTLGFFTNFLQIRSADAELYKAMQAFNQLIFRGSIALILGMVVMYATEVHKTESNGLFTKAVSVINGLGGLGFSYYLLTMIPEFKERYLAINLEDIQIYFEKYTLNTLTFELGTLFAYVFAVASILLILGVFVKNTED